MIQKLNFGILITLIVFFFYGLFQLLFNEKIYPFGLILFFSLVSITGYFALYHLRTIQGNVYLAFSILSFINSVILFADYFYPSLLIHGWNYSFMLTFILIISALIVRIQKIDGKLSTLTFWITCISGILILVGLLFKLSSPFLHSIVKFSFGISSVFILILFGLQFKKKTKHVS